MFEPFAILSSIGRPETPAWIGFDAFASPRPFVALIEQKNSQRPVEVWCGSYSRAVQALQRWAKVKHDGGMAVRLDLLVRYSDLQKLWGDR